MARHNCGPSRHRLQLNLVIAPLKRLSCQTRVQAWTGEGMYCRPCPGPCPSPCQCSGEAMTVLLSLPTIDLPRELVLSPQGVAVIFISARGGSPWTPSPLTLNHVRIRVLEPSLFWANIFLPRLRHTYSRVLWSFHLYRFSPVLQISCRISCRSVPYLHVKQKLPKVKISKRCPFFLVIFWYCSKGDVILPCHDATQSNGKPM